ncbi:MAG: integrase core domain-containing protein [Armatimonadota bacterium]
MPPGRRPRRLPALHLHDYASSREARRQLAGYFDSYNHARPHQSLPPAQVHRGAIGDRGNLIR